MTAEECDGKEFAGGNGISFSQVTNIRWQLSEERNGNTRMSH